MGNPAGSKRNFDALEMRRMQAARLLRQGVSEAETARRLGVHRQSVNRWARQLERKGAKGLKKAGRAGRKSRLSAADWKAIDKALRRGSESLGYKTGLWTTRRVAELIERKYGVRYHPVHVGKLLRKLGWNWRWLIIRASRRDEDARRQKGTTQQQDPKAGRGKTYVRVTAWLPGVSYRT